VISTSSRCYLLQLVACGGRLCLSLSLLATCSCVSLKTFDHLIKLIYSTFDMHCLLVITMSMHVCKLDPGAHVFNAFGFAFKFGVDKVVPEPC
jgi:hypothetical protein